MDAGRIKGVKISRGSPTISHLMYVDDVVLFWKAFVREVTAMIDCLEKYCEWSGKSMNKDKSRFITSKSTHRETERQVASILNMRKMPQDSKYLGNPMFLTKRRTRDFKFVKDKLEGRLASSKGRHLSWAARSTLIRSVAQSSPLYSMLIFELPRKICEYLVAITRRFWWKQRAEEFRYLALRSWDSLCQPKNHGGLGFRRSKDVNFAMLEKLGWIILTDHDKLCPQVLRSKYKVRRDWLH